LINEVKVAEHRRKVNCEYVQIPIQSLSTTIYHSLAKYSGTGTKVFWMALPLEERNNAAKGLFGSMGISMNVLRKKLDSA